ncbi:MAG TPA: hypothetical protein PKJ51_01600 [Methanothrix sp.]|nr:hypothetical protein [Methanothrix sp.]
MDVNFDQILVVIGAVLALVAGTSQYLKVKHAAEAARAFVVEIVEAFDDDEITSKEFEDIIGAAKAFLAELRK